MPIRKNILVKGFVQGVSYRKQTVRVATHLGVRGWIRNLSNGNVEACLEGEEAAVDALIAWCAFGPKKGRVDEVRILPSSYGGDYADFSINEDRQIS
jgi:acylphosphatase